MSSAAWERYLKAYRREQMRRTMWCLIMCLALVGAAAVVSGAIRYFAA